MKTTNQVVNALYDHMLHLSLHTTDRFILLDVSDLGDGKYSARVDVSILRADWGIPDRHIETWTYSPDVGIWQHPAQEPEHS